MANGEKGDSTNQDTSLDEVLGDPTVSRTISEDPVFKFLFKWWRQLLTLAVAAAVVFYGRQQFEQARLARMGEASDLYRRVAAEFNNLSLIEQRLKQDRLQSDVDENAGAESGFSAANLERQRQDSERRLKELLASLADTRRPYEGLSDLYKALLARFSGEAFKAGQLLAEAHGWEALKTGSAARFAAELKALALARILLDSESDYAQARSILKALAEKGELVNVSAAVSLSRISLGQEEKKEALQAIEKLIGQYPEQAALLDEEVARLKI